ncbi:hypothetical protein [Canibacter zhoujuaniae]|uniref:hypothetical protein n=1 Tax=Canibacter zhoujuaniae TaxID=2708343 RepID=UPI001423824B|nr:hypothetical protein [Canibacter zhoujuaniae]
MKKNTKILAGVLIGITGIALGSGITALALSNNNNSAQSNAGSAHSQTTMQAPAQSKTTTGSQQQNTNSTGATANTVAPGGTRESFEAALNTVAQQSNNAQIIKAEFDSSDQHWDIEAFDGTNELEYTVSADGTSVFKSKSETADNDDRAKYASATVDILAAANFAALPADALIDEFDLTHHNRQIAWKVDYYGSDKKQVRTIVDATTGALL